MIKSFFSLLILLSVTNTSFASMEFSEESISVTGQSVSLKLCKGFLGGIARTIKNISDTVNDKDTTYSDEEIERLRATLGPLKETLKQASNFEIVSARVELPQELKTIEGEFASATGGKVVINNIGNSVAEILLYGADICNFMPEQEKEESTVSSKTISAFLNSFDWEPKQN